LLNALIYLPLALWLWKAPYGPRFRKGAPGPVRAVKGFSDIVSTIRDISGNRAIVPMILLAGVTSFFVGNGYQPQMPEFAHDLGHGDPTCPTACCSPPMRRSPVRGIPAREPRAPSGQVAHGAAAGDAVVLRDRRIRASTSYALALAILFAVGFLELSFNAMAQTLVQLHAPAPIRGRVIGLYILSGLGMRAFSGVTVGSSGASSASTGRSRCPPWRCSP